MNWLHAAIFFALFAGHCELMAAWVNRLHALPFPKSILRPTRLLHDLLVVGFLPFAITAIGFRGPAVFRGGCWCDLSTPWLVYVALCTLGLLSLLLHATQWCLSQQPELRSTRTIDVAAEFGYPPAGPGLRGRIARLPGNEVFQLEINEKELTIPGLPPACAGLSIAHFSDVHFRGPVTLDYFRHAFAQIAELNADLVIFTGDLLDNQRLVDWLPETFGRLRAPLGCWYILGNHDWLLDPAPMRAALNRLDWNDLSGIVCQFNDGDRRIALAGDETPWLGTPPDLTTAEPDRLTILLSHTPDNIARADRQSVHLMLSGHNHGGQVRLPLIGPVYSPSLYGIRFASGTFRRGPTTLHVTRGLSAERPVRWNCPPEITRITLK